VGRLLDGRGPGGKPRGNPCPDQGPNLGFSDFQLYWLTGRILDSSLGFLNGSANSSAQRCTKKFMTRHRAGKRQPPPGSKVRLRRNSGADQDWCLAALQGQALKKRRAPIGARFI
jgi:hypothetical protein